MDYHSYHCLEKLQQLVKMWGLFWETRCWCDSIYLVGDKKVLAVGENIFGKGWIKVLTAITLKALCFHLQLWQQLIQVSTGDFSTKRFIGNFVLPSWWFSPVLLALLNHCIIVHLQWTNIEQQADVVFWRRIHMRGNNSGSNQLWRKTHKLCQKVVLKYTVQHKGNSPNRPLCTASSCTELLWPGLQSLELNWRSGEKNKIYTLFASYLVVDVFHGILL